MDTEIQASNMDEIFPVERQCFDKPLTQKSRQSGEWKQGKMLKMRRELSDFFLSLRIARSIYW